MVSIDSDILPTTTLIREASKVCACCIVQYEISNALFMDGKTLYPKKQFHSSPSWVCLHFSGTTPPQYLKGQVGRKDFNNLTLYSSLQMIVM